MYLNNYALFYFELYVKILYIRSILYVRPIH